MSMAQMAGARLAYVVVPQEGSVRRNVHKFDKKGGGIKVMSVEEPAGYLVYFPRGHVIRIKDKKELKRYKLDKEAPLVNLQGLSDPNSPIGKLMRAQDEGGRLEAMAQIEKSVMMLAQAQSGRIELTRDPADLYYHEEREEA